jgi:hypothetical protein
MINNEVLVSVLTVLKQDNPHKGSDGNEKLPPRTFCTVEIVR